MVHSFLRPPQRTASSQSMMQSIRHWWTQSNVQALHRSQDQLLQSCVQTPYVYTSFAGMNSVEFQRRKCETSSDDITIQNTNIAATNPMDEETDIFKLETSSGYYNNTTNIQNNNNNHCNSTLHHFSHHNHNRHSNHDRRCYHTNRHLYRMLWWHPHHHHDECDWHHTPTPRRTTAAVASDTTNTVTATTERTTVIMTHGFGSGLGFFCKNVDLFFDYYAHVDRVVLVDWFGMGGSDRPPIYPKKRRTVMTTTATATSTELAVNFFIEPFHEWFEQSIIERRRRFPHEPCPKEQIVLVGHSLGGYLCGQYAMKYPQHLSKLVLASPVGFSCPSHTTTSTATTQNQPPPSLPLYHLYQPHPFSENLYNIHPCNAIPAIPTSSTPSQHDMTTAKKEHKNPIFAIPPTLGDNTENNVTGSSTSLNEMSTLNETSTKTKNNNNESTSTNTIAAVMPSSKKSIIRILSTLWRSNVTPQQLIRMCGATHGRANVHRKLRQKLNATTTSTPGSVTNIAATSSSHDEDKAGTVNAATDVVDTSTQATPTNVHSDHDIQLLADYLYHITVADPSGEFAMNALLEPTLVTIVPMPSSATTALVQNETPQQQHQNDSLHKPAMNETSTSSCDVADSLRIPSALSNPIPSQDSSVISSFLFPKELTITKNDLIGLHSPTTLSSGLNPGQDIGNNNSVQRKDAWTKKTYSAMGVSAREPLQELLAQTLDTSQGLHCVKVLYGSHDWMRPNETIARQSLQQLHVRTGIETSVNVIPNVGHHLYMESPLEFVKHIMN